MTIVPPESTLLDVMVEGLEENLATMGWTVKTVTREIGACKECRNDDKILQFARDKQYVVITNDKRFVKKLEDANLPVFTINNDDRANILHNKLSSTSN